MAHAARLPGDDRDHASTPEHDAPYNPQLRWEDPCGEEDVGDEESGHAADLARLLENGTQAIREDLTVRTRERNRTLEDLVCEIDQLSKIGQHPNIVGFVGASIDENNFTEPVIVLEYMDGGCLHDVMAAKSKNGSSWRPPKETSFSWCAQLCAALNFLHDRETPLVHRDVKSANLFCSADLKTLKLGDFGLCRPVRTLQGGNMARTMTGMTGTFTHMAPEVLDATEEGYCYSETADVFSGAVCMVHLITGEHAYLATVTEWRPETLARR
ncbi:kinase-like domain-containing protein, partial [Baffinella frigidus]